MPKLKEEAFLYEYLKELCHQGEVDIDAFQIEEDQIRVYADVLQSSDTDAQVVFQLHHALLEDTIIDPVYGMGESQEECLRAACKNFYEHDLCLLMQAIHEKAKQQIVAKTQENHAFDCFESAITTVGKREGELPESFYEELKEEIKKRLGNKRSYIVKVYCVKMGNKGDADVRINDVKSKALSAFMKAYVDSWDCIDRMHSEKQTFFFLQKEETYLPPVFTKNQIKQYAKKAIALYEKCDNQEAYKKLRMQLIKLCKDESLGMELFGFIPELYCKHAFSDIAYGEELYLIQKNVPTKTFYQSQVRSFSYIEEVIRLHLKKEEVSSDTIETVVAYSANYRAIQKAIDEGEDVKDLYTPGIGYFVKEDYLLR